MMHLVAMSFRAHDFVGLHAPIYQYSIGHVTDYIMRQIPFFFQVQLPFDSQMRENTLCDKKLCWVTAASKLDIYFYFSSTSCSYIALLQILLVTFTHYKICMCCCVHKNFQWTCLIGG
jgi:hypothetical protein